MASAAAAATALANFCQYIDLALGQVDERSPGTTAVRTVYALIWRVS